jgi:hypothetical protein
MTTIITLAADQLETVTGAGPESDRACKEGAKAFGTATAVAGGLFGLFTGKYFVGTPAFNAAIGVPLGGAIGAAMGCCGLGVQSKWPK